jgi:hypothetical protein
VKLPWRVDDFERLQHSASEIGPVAYFIVDKTGIVIALFADLDTAKMVVNLVNGSASVPPAVG